MTEVDFDRLTEFGRHLSESGELTAPKFRDMMERELERYIYRFLANNLAESGSREFKSTVLLLKLIELRLTELISSQGHDLSKLLQPESLPVARQKTPLGGHGPASVEAPSHEHAGGARRLLALAIANLRL